MRSKFKIISLIFISLTFLAAFVFQDLIFFKCVEYSLKSYCKDHLHLNLTAPNLKYGNQVLIFENPKFFQEDDPNHPKITADQLLIFFEPHFFKREIDLYLTLVDPKMDLTAIAPVVRTVLQEKKQTSPFFNIHHQLQIINGEMLISENDETKEIYFNSTHNLIGTNELKINASMNCINSEENCFSFHLKEDLNERFKLQAEFNDFSGFYLHLFLSLIVPEMPFELHEGVINGNLNCAYEEQVTEIVSDLSLNEVSCMYKPLNVYGKVAALDLQVLNNKGIINLDESFLLAELNESTLLECNHLKGKALFELDFTSIEAFFLKSIVANFAVDEGKLVFESNQLPLFTDFKTDFEIDQGQVVKSTAEGKLFGLDGKADFNFFNPDQLIKFHFRGRAQPFLSLFPEVTRKKMNPFFKQADLSFDGEVKKIVDALTLQELFSINGEVNVLDCGEKSSLFYGFEWEKMSLQNGWLQANHLDLEKYLAPFIIDDVKTRLTGEGNFQGTFNDQSLHIVYDQHNVVLENEHFVIETKKIEGAEEFFDLKRGISFGNIPIKNGTYFEKNSGLLFTDIAAKLSLSGAKITAPFIEAFCNGVYFKGSHELDLSSPNEGEFDLSFHIPMMKGKFSAVQQIFSHFNKPYFFLKMPLDADVEFRQKGALITFNFKKEECKISAVVQGEISNGSIQSDHFDVSCQELNVNFDYDYEENRLTFSDMGGALLVGKPELVEEYLLASDEICFTDYLNNEAQFDFWIGDKNRDIVRIVGKTSCFSHDSHQELIEILLNKELSHFGNMQLQSFHCVLKDWTEIEALNLKLPVKLDALLCDLQRFSRTGCFFLSTGLLKEMNALKRASGNFLVNLDYDKTRSHFNYSMTGKEIEIGSYKFDTAVLKGTKNGNFWSIEELKLDEISLAADITNLDEYCKINFLGIQMGSCLLVGLEGEYRPKELAIYSQVNLFEADFKHLNEWPRCKRFVEEFKPKGVMQATGELKVQFREESPLPTLDLLLNASFKECQMMGLMFKDAEKVSCHYLSDQGVIVRGFKTEIIDTESSLDIDKVEYDLKNHAFLTENLQFKIPAKNLLSFTDRFEKAFPHLFSKHVLNTLSGLKKKDFFEGMLSFEFSKPHYALSLSLKNGLYHLFGRDHKIEDFVLDYDPCEFKFTTKYHHDQYPFHLSLHSKSESLEFGKLILRDLHLNEEEMPLSIYWRRHPESGVAIETAEGQFAGLYARLYRNSDAPLEEKKFHLQGDVDVNIEHLSCILPAELKKPLSDLKLGKGFTFKGNWSLQDFDFLNSTFKGELIGSDFECKDYQFQTLLADVDYQKNQLLLNRFQVDDPCGTLYADEIKCVCRQSNQWEVAIPLIEVQDFRPSLVRQVGMIGIPYRKPFVIHQLELEHLEGNLFDLNSFTGYGRFSFRNPHKKNFQNTILAIPAEIISRIGLDPTVLTPVIGTVEYQILNEKILLNKFKDIYSEGKLTKFYLAEAPYPSYVDFQGNLFLKIRMKHESLLLKLAELFIVNVQGNLKKPLYSFQKQTKHDLDPFTFTE